MLNTKKETICDFLSFWGEDFVKHLDQGNYDKDIGSIKINREWRQIHAKSQPCRNDCKQKFELLVVNHQTKQNEPKKCRQITQTKRSSEIP